MREEEKFQMLATPAVLHWFYSCKKKKNTTHKHIIFTWVRTQGRLESNTNTYDDEPLLTFAEASLLTVLICRFPWWKRDERREAETSSNQFLEPFSRPLSVSKPLNYKPIIFCSLNSNLKLETLTPQCKTPKLIPLCCIWWTYCIYWRGTSFLVEKNT